MQQRDKSCNPCEHNLYLTKRALMSELSSCANPWNLLTRVSGISCFPASLITSCLSSPGAASRTPPRNSEKKHSGPQSYVSAIAWVGKGNFQTNFRPISIHHQNCTTGITILCSVIKRFINLQRACATRVRVLGLCVCVSVCLLPLFHHPRLLGGQRAMRYQQPQAWIYKCYLLQA